MLTNVVPFSQMKCAAVKSMMFSLHSLKRVPLLLEA